MKVTKESIIETLLLFGPREMPDQMTKLFEELELQHKDETLDLKIANANLEVELAECRKKLFEASSGGDK